MKKMEKANSNNWEFFDRIIIHEFSLKSLIYQLSKEVANNVKFATQYDPLTDGLLLSIYYKNPPGRIFR